MGAEMQGDAGMQGDWLLESLLRDMRLGHGAPAMLRTHWLEQRADQAIIRSGLGSKADPRQRAYALGIQSIPTDAPLPLGALLSGNCMLYERNLLCSDTLWRWNCTLGTAMHIARPYELSLAQVWILAGYIALPTELVVKHRAHHYRWLPEPFSLYPHPLVEARFSAEAEQPARIARA